MNSDKSKSLLFESGDGALPSRKRMPLDPISPSAQKDSKRRGGDVDGVYLKKTSCNSASVVNNSENSNPNIQYSAAFSDCGNQKSTRISLLNQSGDVHRRVLETFNHNESPSSGLSQVNYKNSAHRVQTPLTSILTGKNGIRGNQMFLSPSQRRLHNVDLSGVSYESPTSRCIQSSKKLNSTLTPYQLPASNIIGNVSPTTNNMDPRLLATYNQDRRMGDVQYPYISQSHTLIHPRVTETVEAARLKEIKNHVEVIVPELDDLGVARPEWFPQNSTSSSGAKNLLNDFNKVAGQFTSRDISQNEAHVRGEYFSDDEIDSSIYKTDLWKGYMDLGKPTKICQKCKARMWNEERNNKSSKNAAPTFSLCCKDGQAIISAYSSYSRSFYAGEVGDNMDPKSANSTGNTADKGKGTDSEQVPMDLDDQEKKSTDVTDKEAVRTQKRKLRESEADSEAQKSPSKVGYTMKPEDHLVAVRHSPSMTSPTNISNQAISSKSPKAKKTHSSSRSISTDTQGDLKDAGQSSHGDDPLLGGFWFSNLTRASVPVGTLFQTELPEFSKNAYEGDTKWLGTLIWPQGQVVVPSVPPTGFGRRDQCTCVSRGSSECVRFHLSEERNRLNLELGMSFDQFRFDTMGEAAASSWSSRDQTRFQALMRTNPPNADGKVWNKIRGRFRAKRMDQLVSYYFNVYQIRRHRQNPHDTDSDDDIVSDKYLKL